MLTVSPVKAAPGIFEVCYNAFQDANGTWHSSIGSGTPIQDAVDWAVNYLPGADTFKVHPTSWSGASSVLGPYQEHVTVPNALWGSTFVAIGSVTLDNVPGGLSYGFELVGTSDITIKGFTIQNYVEAGIYLHKDWFGTGSPSFLNHIRNNIVQNNYGHGILLGDSHMNEIKSNTVQYNDKIGMFIDNGAKNRIKGNTVHGNTMSGIEYHIAPYTEVAGNDVSDNGLDGLNADGYSGNSIIKGNVFDHNGLNGINVISGSNTIKGNNVSRNGINGIMLAQGDDNVVWGNLILLNGLDGVFVTYSWWNRDSSDRNSIRFNEVYGNLRHGIFVYTSDWNKVWNNTVIDNMGTGIQVTAESPPYLAEYNTIYSNFVMPNGLANPSWYFDLYYDGWHGWNNNLWGGWGSLPGNGNTYGTWGHMSNSGTSPGPFP